MRQFLASAVNLRVYEYVADDGTTYWSLTRHPSIVSAPKRLVLQDKRGTVLGQFLVELRHQGELLDSGGAADESGG